MDDCHLIPVGIVMIYSFALYFLIGGALGLRELHLADQRFMQALQHDKEIQDTFSSDILFALFLVVGWPVWLIILGVRKCKQN